MNIAVCVKQIPDPAEPGALDPDHTLEAEGKLILDESDSYGVEMALQLVDKAGGGEVTLVSMAPDATRSTACAPRSPWAPPRPSSSATTPSGRRRPRHRQGAGRRHQADRARPRAGRHRVDRRLHRHRARAGRRAPRPAVGDLRQARRGRPTAPLKVQRQTEAGYDEVECPLPAVVSVTAGVVEPRYPSFKGIMAAKSKPVDEVDRRRPRHRRRQRRLGRRRPGDRRRRGRPRSAQAGEVIEDDGEGHRQDRRVPREPEGDLTMRHS